MAGTPGSGYELLLGLWMNASRVESRQAYRALRAARDSFDLIVPEEYFRALYDTEEEAAAQHALHVSRCSEPMSAGQVADEGVG